MCNALASFALLRRVGGHWEGKRCYMLRFLPVRVMAEMHSYSYSFCDSYSCSDRKHTLSACLFTSAGGGVGKRLHVIVFYIAVSRDILTISASTFLANALLCYALRCVMQCVALRMFDILHFLTFLTFVAFDVF